MKFQLPKILDLFRNISILETILSFRKTTSRFDSPFADAVRNVVSTDHPRVPIIPNIMSGFTDSHFFRKLGIHCYGFMPFLLPDDDLRGIHGNNEGISLENMNRGPKILYAIMEKSCG
jgi:acetylornithine deacetylase/succinyl-diaminopimelate desuccinylase-like protein